MCSSFGITEAIFTPTIFINKPSIKLASMSKSEVKKVSRIKTRKKIWHTILATAAFGKKEMGESYLGSAAEALNRQLKVNLKDLTGNMKDQNAYVSFKITKWQGTTLETAHTGYELTTSSIKRMVKKNVNRLDDYFLFNTKDKQPVVVKTLMLTIKKISRSIQTQLRKVLGEILAEEFQKNDFDAVFGNIVSFKTQLQAKKQLAKVYPLKELAIRKLSLISKKDAAVKQEAPAIVSEGELEKVQVEEPVASV